MLGVGRPRALDRNAKIRIMHWSGGAIEVGVWGQQEPRGRPSAPAGGGGGLGTCEPEMTALRQRVPDRNGAQMPRPKRLERRAPVCFCSIVLDVAPRVMRLGTTCVPDI